MNAEGQCVPMKVWRPDGSVVRVRTIAGDDDHFGNLVAEGHLSEDEYWPSLVAASRQRERRLREKYLALRDSVESALSEPGQRYIDGFSLQPDGKLCR